MRSTDEGGVAEFTALLVSSTKPLFRGLIPPPFPEVEVADDPVEVIGVAREFQFRAGNWVVVAARVLGVEQVLG